MTTTTATLCMLLLLCVSLGQIRLVSTNSATIPEDGVYIISMVADPEIKTDTILQLNGNDAGFVAYGRDGVVGGLSAALYLKAGTNVSAKVYGGAGRLDVALVTKTKNNFVTVRSKGYFWQKSNLIHFHHRYNAQGVWKSIPATSTFSVPTAGIYWVMARINCEKGNKRASVMIGDGLFNAYCTDGKAASASGAFYLEAGRQLNLAFNNNNLLSVKGATIFSFVRLESNLAFTAWVAYGAPRESHERISFDGFTPTNYGDLYESSKRLWHIPVAGSYIVAVRGDPDNNNMPLNVLLYKSGRKHVFTWYNEGGTKSGQAGIFQFKAGEKLVMIDPNGRHMDRETFMSIALLRAA